MGRWASLPRSPPSPPSFPMLTIGKRHHGSWRNYVELCGDCGTLWMQTALERNADGNLRCPQCREPETANELLEQGALNVASIEPPPVKTREEP